MTEIQRNMNHIRHGPGPPIYHPQHGSGGMGQVERSTSSTAQHQRFPDVSGNHIVTFDVERQSNAGFSGTIGDGSKADRVCGLRPSFATPTQPHRRHSVSPSSFQHGTNSMGTRGPDNQTQYGNDEWVNTNTAHQSFPPTREQPRSLDLAYGSFQRQHSTSCTSRRAGSQRPR